MQQLQFVPLWLIQNLIFAFGFCDLEKWVKPGANLSLGAHVSGANLVIVDQ